MGMRTKKGYYGKSNGWASPQSTRPGGDGRWESRWAFWEANKSIVAGLPKPLQIGARFSYFPFFKKNNNKRSFIRIDQSSARKLRQPPPCAAQKRRFPTKKKKTQYKKKSLYSEKTKKNEKKRKARGEGGHHDGTGSLCNPPRSLIETNPPHIYSWTFPNFTLKRPGWENTFLPSTLHSLFIVYFSESPLVSLL